MPKYEFDTVRWLRNVAEVQSHRAGAGPAMLRENMLKCAVEIERLREFIRNGVDLGYIVIPDKSDPARDAIDRICGGGSETSRTGCQMTQQIQFDSLRYCRSNAGRMGTWMNTDDVATMIADELNALRNAVEKLQAEAEALRAMGHELAALKEAARPVVKWWRKDRMVADPPYQIEHVVLGTDGPECVGVGELDALAALVGVKNEG